MLDTTPHREGQCAPSSSLEVDRPDSETTPPTGHLPAHKRATTTHAATAAQPCPHPGCPELKPCPTHPGRTRWRRTPMPPGWARTRRRILHRDPTCQCPGCPRCTNQPCAAPSTDCDHIHDHDNHTDHNLRGLCQPCHRHRTSNQATRARRNQAANPNRPARTSSSQPRRRIPPGSIARRLRLGPRRAATPQGGDPNPPNPRRPGRGPLTLRPGLE